MPTLDELFDEFEQRQLEDAAKDDTPEIIARRESRRKQEIEREIRQGLRDAEGNWVEQPETDEQEEDEDGEAL